MDYVAFLTMFPEFANPASFPQSTIAFWLGIAGGTGDIAGLINEVRWCDQYALGIGLFTAHYIVLETQAARTAAFNGVPGQNTGPLSAKAVDKVSMTFDANAGSIEGAGNWNLTTYGTRFYALSRMFGAGSLQF